MAGSESRVRFQWFTANVMNTLQLKMSDRVRLATEYLKTRIVTNISRPVTKYVGPKSGRIQVKDRSKPGEFPKADTTQLMKTIFTDFADYQGVPEGYIGTPLDYGLFLEVKMSRSFLLRTLNEERDTLSNILTTKVT